MKPPLAPKLRPPAGAEGSFAHRQHAAPGAMYLQQLRCAREPEKNGRRLIHSGSGSEWACEKQGPAGNVLRGEAHAGPRLLPEAPRRRSAPLGSPADSQELLECVPAAIFFKDRNNRFLRVNQTFSELLGKPKEHIENQSCFDLFPRRDAEAFWKDDCEVMATGIPKRNIVESAHVSRREIWFQTDKVPYRNQQGEIIGVIGLALDITGRKRCEEMLRTQGAVFDHLLEAVCLIDEHGIIRLTNPALDRMFGYLEGELIGKSAAVLGANPGRGHAAWPKAAEDLARRPRGPLAEFHSQTKDGRRLVTQGRAFPVTLGGKNYSAWIQQDITERKQLEGQLLNVSQREQERIGQDLHDGLCQQLVSIALATDLVRKDAAEGGRVKLSRLHKIKNRLDEAIGQARTLSHELYPANLTRQGLQLALRRLARSVSQPGGIRCIFQCVEPVFVRNQSSAMHLYRIAQEAVDNALKHAAATEIRITLEGGLEAGRLAIADNGRGMAASGAHDKGIGLSIMRHRAGAVGGQLHLQSRPAGGTTVTCHFPKSAL